MPIYQYKCESCEEQFEAIVKYDDRERKQECPKCTKKEGVYDESPQAFAYSQGRSFSRMRHGQ